MIKLVLFFILMSSYVLAGADDIANKDVESEILQEEMRVAQARAKAMIINYYNKQVPFHQDASNYDNKFEFEKVSSIELADNMASHFDSGIEFEIGQRPQIYTPAKLRYSLRMEAMKSLNPNDENNYRSARAETDAPSLYEVVTSMLVYKILQESHKKINQPKYYELGGIMHISAFNTCQLPIVTSREAPLIPDSQNESYESQLSAVKSGYRDYITYGSEAYTEYIDWLVSKNSELINSETGLMKSLDFDAYYNMFKPSAENLKATFFSNVPANQFKEAGQLVAGYRYERYEATQREDKVERSIQSYDKVDLLSPDLSSDGLIEVNDTKIGELIGEFLKGEVYFNATPVPGKHYILDKNTPAENRAGYSLKKLSDLSPKILGFYCKSSSSNIPNTSGTNLKAKAEQINGELQAIANENQSFALGVENAKIDQKFINQCQANGDDCNSLLSDLRRATCFESAFKGLKNFFAQENLEKNRDLFQYFSEGEDGKRFEIVEKDYPSDVALRNTSNTLNSKPLQFYSGNAVTDGQGFKYLFCNIDPAKDGQLKGFDRRKDCLYGTDIEAMKNNPNLPSNVNTSLNAALESVGNNQMPTREHLERIKDHFYRVDQYSRLGIIYAVDIEQDNSRPVMVSCADGVAIRFYGEEKEGENQNPDRTLTDNPFSNTARHESVIAEINADKPIPECRTLRTGRNRGIAKNEMRHCYRLKRNLKLLRSDTRN